jgi:formylglycine-generating enzyme required for sulfatase activity
LGLFDTHGNAYSWCLESFGEPRLRAAAGAVIDDREGALVVTQTDGRAVHGGSFLNPPSYMRSAHRGGSVPSATYVFIGFRVARTLTL